MTLYCCFCICTVLWINQFNLCNVSIVNVVCLFVVRLMRGNYRSNGMVEVYHKNKGWSTVCASGFGETEAGR